ncbi:MAG: PEGA domain-containing protein [Spirochaetales bacterium]|nr:PEGA domain-containing protein [Spirochaetales bacterium]
MKTLRIPFFLYLLFVFIPFSVSSQDRDRIAVLPLTAVGVPKAHADACTYLLETSLVKTGIFHVLEQGQMSAILEAQRFSLSGCTDDSCAVEVGRLLSAEKIVVGSVVAVGKKFAMTAKIINVEIGLAEIADEVGADSIEELSDLAGVLAAKLAGLDVEEFLGTGEATGFGDVFVQTDPPGAVIFFRGENRGVSPDVLKGLPAGSQVLRAEKDNLSGTAEIQVIADSLAQVTITLQEAKGSLFIKTDEPGLKVYLNDQYIGVIETGIFQDVPAGEYNLEVKGRGLLWEDRIIIGKGKTTVVTAQPRPDNQVRIEELEAEKRSIESQIAVTRGVLSGFQNKGVRSLIGGVLLAGVGGGIIAYAASEYDTRDPEFSSLAGVGATGAGVGVALIANGLIGLKVGGETEEEKAKKRRIREIEREIESLR